MWLQITNHGGQLIENRIYNFELQKYPNMQPWEWNSIKAFISYEKAHGRKTEILCADSILLRAVQEAAAEISGSENILPLPEVTEKFIYHATDFRSAQKIFRSGKLLSAARVYGKSGKQLAYEKRESNWNDPADFFEYIMFGWGSHLVGDYVVLSENPPKAADLAAGRFDAGVRFYFKYEQMLKHPGSVFDGYHPLKIKDEVLLYNDLFACIVPEQFQKEVATCISPELIDKVHYLSQRGLTLSDWNNKVVQFVNSL